MLRLVFGFLLFGSVAATQAAQSDDEFSAPKLDLITSQFIHTGTFPHYKISASVMLTPSPDSSSIESLPDSTSHSFSTGQLQKETDRAINFHWQPVIEHVPLAHLLRVEFRGEQASVAFRPHLLLIEKEALKFRLQPHSASMLWSKAF